MPHQTTHDSAEMETCIRACTDCVRACAESCREDREERGATS